MAILEVNHNPIDFESSEYLNLKSLIPKLQKNFPRESYHLEKFQVNGVSIDLNSEDPALIRPIENSDHINVIFNRTSSPLGEIINDLPILIDKTMPKIIACSRLFEDNMKYEATKSLSQVIDAVDTFISTISYAVKSIKVQGDDISELPIKELQIHLLSILKAIHNAHNLNDSIMLTDLLEYELKDNLTQWKILIIPVLKKILRQEVLPI